MTRSSGGNGFGVVKVGGVDGEECLREGDVRGTSQILVMKTTLDFIHWKLLSVE